MSLSTLGRFAFVLSFPAFVVACVVDSSPPYATGGSGGSAGEETGTAYEGGAGGGPSEHPILVPIDTNTNASPIVNTNLSAQPGEGVGVFTEYDGAGLWHVWWTCDLIEHPNNPPCPFDVKVDVQSGAITQPQTIAFGTADTLTSSPTELEAVTTTSTGSDGITFQTTPGATITLSATVGGQYDPRFIFFVAGES